jgi:hypothetical protein
MQTVMRVFSVVLLMGSGLASSVWAQQVPSSYGGSVSAGDGSTIPGFVSVMAYCLPSGCGPDWTLYSGPAGGITVPGPNNIGVDNFAQFQNYAINGAYFGSVKGSTITCIQESTAPFNTNCFGSFDLKLYAKEGALQGTVTTNPLPASGDLSGITVQYRTSGGGSGNWAYLTTNSAGHYEKRAQTEPQRSEHGAQGRPL